jgi:peroxiredoxin (alkyl hydroperoxide reductase subunit C)
MEEDTNVGCARPTGGPVGEPMEEKTEKEEITNKDVKKMIRVGQKAPDFSAPAYFKGKFHLARDFGVRRWR